jgi:hypothetical protein
MEFGRWESVLGETEGVSLCTRVGGGPEGSQQGGVREGLRALVREVRKVYSHRRKLCQEIVKNKFPSNYQSLLLINTFRYHLDFTS